MNAARCCEDAVGYERLRSGALSGTLAHGCAALGVLLSRGLASWLSTAPPPEPRASPTTVPSTPLPAALASIILRLTKEASHA
jgi:hypothetical protein